MINKEEQKLLCKSMLDDLRKKIHEKNVDILKNKEKLEKEKFIGKISINKAISSDEKKVRVMTELFAKIYAINISTGKSTVIVKPEFKKAVERLCAVLSDKEVESFIKVFDHFVKCNNENEIKNANYDMYCIDVLTKQAGLENELFHINDETMEYGKAIDKLRSVEVKTDDITINYKGIVKEKGLPIAEQRLVSEVLKLKTNGLSIYDESSSLILYNIYGIRNAFASRARINSVLQSITSLVEVLDKIEDFSVINVKSYLTKLTIRYTRELEKVAKYLDKYDFSSIINQLYRQEEEKQVTETTRLKMDYYAGMSFELERIKNEEPESADLILLLNKKMSSFAVNSGLSSKQLEAASESGVREYHQEDAIFNEIKDGGKALYNEYLDYCNTVKGKNQLSFTDYVKTYHGLDELDSIAEYNGEGFKM